MEVYQYGKIFHLFKIIDFSNIGTLQIALSSFNLGTLISKWINTTTVKSKTALRYCSVFPLRILVMKLYHLFSAT